jgi:nucleoside transporter
MQNDENPYAPPKAHETRPTDPLLDSSSANLKVRLSVMMFLQYFVQGCYLPVVALYLQDALKFTPVQIGWFLSALAIGPLVAPFLVGQLVDRRFATQHVLTASHLLSGLVMLVLYVQKQFWLVVILGTVYSVLYVPTMMLTNALAFHHLRNRDREFPIVRLWGTIGFIMPAWLIELVFLRGLQGEPLNNARGVVLVTSGIAGIVMAMYSLALPHTPPTRKTSRSFAPGAALQLVRQRRFLVLVVISFLIGVVHNYYFALNSPFLKSILVSGGVLGAWEQRISSLGQIAEIGVMAVLGLAIARLGFKRVMLIGTLAYLIRCLIFAAADYLHAPFAATMTIVCLGQLLHGLCFGCFMATAFIYLDRTTPTDIRGSVQTLYGTFVLGLGIFAGGIVSGQIRNYFTTGSDAAAISNWTAIWLSGAAISAVCVLGFGLLFPRETPTSPELPPHGSG